MLNPLSNLKRNRTASAKVTDKNNLGELQLKIHREAHERAITAKKIPASAQVPLRPVPSARPTTEHDPALLVSSAPSSPVQPASTLKTNKRKDPTSVKDTDSDEDEQSLPAQSSTSKRMPIF